MQAVVQSNCEAFWFEENCVLMHNAHAFNGHELSMEDQSVPHNYNYSIRGVDVYIHGRRLNNLTNHTETVDPQTLDPQIPLNPVV